MLDVQRLAAHAVGQVQAGRNLSVALQSAWRRKPGLSPQQRAAIQDLSYGVCRHYGALQATLDRLLDKPLRDRELQRLLLVALYQLQFSRAAPHAVVDHAVKTAAALGKGQAKGLVNAVLRNFLRRAEGLARELAADPATRYAYPGWWIETLRGQYPEHWQAILEAGNRHPPMTLRVNARRATPEQYLETLAEAGIEARLVGERALLLSHPLPVDRLPGFAQGMVSVQDAGAQEAARLLDAAAGMRVLDACSAPGGKAAHLLERADIDLLALDNDPERLQKVGQNLARLGLAATLTAGDAARPEQWWDGRPFQRILADVPCSASGVVRRHPDIKCLRRESDIPQFAAQQRAILDSLWRCLARGGKLLYATCSVFAEENGAQITAFLERHEDARRLPPPGLDAPAGQLLPDHLHDGFYYALLAKD